MQNDIAAAAACGLWRSTPPGHNLTPDALPAPLATLRAWSKIKVDSSLCRNIEYTKYLITCVSGATVPAMLDVSSPPIESSAPIGISRPALHLEVVERLLDMIADGSLAPNQRIDEKSICEQLCISRTPLREALLVLESAGMVTLNPRRGARVTKLEPEQIREILEMLGGLEAMAGELACGKARDDEIAAIRRIHERMVEDHRRGDMLAYFKNNESIHSAIVRLAGNQEIAKVHAGLRRRVVRELYLPNGSESRWMLAIEEHEGFLDALERRDNVLLRERLKLHAQHTWDELSRSRPGSQGHSGQFR